MIWELRSPVITVFCQQHGDSWPNSSLQPPPVLCSLSATLFTFLYNLSPALRTLLQPGVANDWHHTSTESLISPTVSLQNYIPGYGSGNQAHVLSLNRQSLSTQLASNIAFSYLIVLEIQREDVLLSNAFTAQKTALPLLIPLLLAYA